MSPTPPNERLDVPQLPPPSSRFVLPPPPSDLLNRLQAFLPRIRDANALLNEQERAEGAEEAVVMEEMSDDSSDEDDSSSDDSSSSSDSEDGASDDGREAGGGARALDTAGQDDAAAQAVDRERDPLAHLMDISARPKVVKKKLLVQEEVVAGAAEGGEDGMQAD
ncbi:uncharacterized protein JCM10292_001964 [Rhodotorula paludigena]|uniref:uncharacterized protein n=1 Tax=Rhodotorula paludigena TaxID=86838 RepID=UPI00316D5B0B